MIRPYLELVRFSHTLFALPFALASMLLAQGGVPSWPVMAAILVCLVACRNTAMAFNRLVDADFDGRNPRTKGRHIPTGVLSRRQVWAFWVLNAAAFLFAAWTLNSLAFWLSLPTLFAVCFYSLTKRFTWGSHFFLGLAIGLSPLGAWVAVRGSLDWLPLWLGACLLLWVSGFDIVYSTQDEAFDRSQGLYSLVTRWGQKGAHRAAKVLHLGMAAALVGGGLVWDLGGYFQFTNALVLLGLLYIHYFRRSESLDSMGRDFFVANAAISGLVLMGLAAPFVAESLGG